MFRKIGDALRRFMIGRYGTDPLNNTLAVASWALFLLGAFLWRPVTLLGWCALAYCLFRMLSRNFPPRRKENAWFLRVTTPLRDRQHRYFRCPGCRQTVRVPRGKGRIAITCPKCRRRFEKKT